MNKKYRVKSAIIFQHSNAIEFGTIMEDAKEDECSLKLVPGKKIYKTSNTPSTFVLKDEKWKDIHLEDV